MCCCPSLKNITRQSWNLDFTSTIQHLKIKLAKKKKKKRGSFGPLLSPQCLCGTSTTARGRAFCERALPSPVGLFRMGAGPGETHLDEETELHTTPDGETCKQNQTSDTWNATSSCGNCARRADVLCRLWSQWLLK